MPVTLGVIAMSLQIVFSLAAQLEEVRFSHSNRSSKQKKRKKEEKKKKNEIYLPDKQVCIVKENNQRFHKAAVVFHSYIYI